MLRIRFVSTGSKPVLIRAEYTCTVWFNTNIEYITVPIGMNRSIYLNNEITLVGTKFEYKKSILIGY